MVGVRKAKKLTRRRVSQASLILTYGGNTVLHVEYLAAGHPGQMGHSIPPSPLGIYINWTGSSFDQENFHLSHILTPKLRLGKQHKFQDAAKSWAI